MMSESLASQTIWAESHALQTQRAVERLASQQFLPRLWNKDPALWSVGPSDEDRIRHRLGWLTIVPVMEAQVGRIEAAANEIRRAGFTHALLLGMGGSGLFSEVCRYTFGVAPGWLDVMVLDTTDPSAIQAAQQRAPLERTLFIVSSKSGSTTEVSALCDYFYAQCRAVTPHDAGKQFIAITDEGTPLETLAQQRGFRHLFAHGPATGQEVGGRFSAVVCFGLVPAALMGIEIRRLLAKAKAMLTACHPTVPISHNPAAQLGAVLGEVGGGGKDKVTMVSSTPLRRFACWVEQLIAESTGKSGKGLIPIDGEPWDPPPFYANDRLFVTLQLAGEFDESLERHAASLAHAGHPLIQFQWRDRYDLGGETIRWFLATVIAAGLMRINPLDEPNVQESKDRTKALLERYAREGTLSSEDPLTIQDGIAVYGHQTNWASRSPGAMVGEFLQQARPGDYVAVLSFLPRTPQLDCAVELLRNHLAKSLKVATMLGHGPRYLHSTGQLHKGGPDRVLFLFLTAEDPVDLPVPEQPYTFSVLKQAQALGDVQALKERHRRILRLDLGRSPETGMSRLLDELRASLTPH